MPFGMYSENGLLLLWNNFIMKNVATGGEILIYPKLINGPTGIQTQDTWLRSFGPALISVVSSV